MERFSSGARVACKEREGKEAKVKSKEEEGHSPNTSLFDEVRDGILSIQSGLSLS